MLIQHEYMNNMVMPGALMKEIKMLIDKTGIFKKLLQEFDLTIVFKIVAIYR